MHIYVATTNPGKLRDFQSAADQAAAADLTLEPLPGLDSMTPPVEDGTTFQANARLKAAFYSRQASGQWVLADDSGLEVEALEGRPGVRSARFAADVGALDPDRGTDASNNDALLLAMLEQTDRRARYQCVLALARDGVIRLTASGTVEGVVLSDPEGTGGFGYDPLFHIPELACTMAQASPHDRMRLSHRSRALRNLLQQLAEKPL